MSLAVPFPVAVKTGTSQAYHDNWTVGFSRNVTVGVWVGNFDRRPLRNSSGVTGAAPIFRGVMLAAERRATGGSFRQDDVLPASEDSAEQEICALSGHAANDWCPTRRREWVAAERPLMPCNWHVAIGAGVVTNWPAEYRSWASAQYGVAAARPLAAATVQAKAKTAPSAETRAELAIVSPANGSTFLIDPTLRREFQTLSLRAAARDSGAIEWSVDDVPVGRADADSKVSWALRPGRHRIVAKDSAGRTAESGAAASNAEAVSSARDLADRGAARTGRGRRTARA